jgi:hypothetical protein
MATLVSGLMKSDEFIDFVENAWNCLLMVEAVCFQDFPKLFDLSTSLVIYTCPEI